MTDDALERRMKALESAQHSIKNDQKINENELIRVKASVENHPALARIMAHERECSIRNQNYERRSEELLEAIKTNNKETADAIKGIYRQMWAAIVGFISVLLLISGYLYVELDHKTHDRFTGSQASEIIEELVKKGILNGNHK